MIVYISGNFPNDSRFDKNRFESVTEKIKEKGHTVLSLIELPKNLKTKNYTDIGFGMISASDAIYILKSDINTLISDLEFKYAVAQGKLILFEGLSDEQF